MSCRRPTFRPRAFSTAITLVGLLGPTGCGYTGGKILYMLGAGREPLIEAEFHLTDGPVLILVDDFGEVVDWPVAKRYLGGALTTELIKRSAAKKIIPQRTLDDLRETDPGFDKRGCREVGQLAGAEQVLWLQARDFLASESIDDLSNAAYFCVTVKVINVLEKERPSRVRLWPTGNDGYQVVARLPGDAVARLKTRDAISKALAEQLAAQVAKLFYDHRRNDS
ncbi:MAG: hypothetical protein ACE5HE_06550 [Phycisphaerae bacterium]